MGIIIAPLKVSFHISLAFQEMYPMTNSNTRSAFSLPLSGKSKSYCCFIDCELMVESGKDVNKPQGLKSVKLLCNV